MKISYKHFDIEILDDAQHQSSSSDNIPSYQLEYGNQDGFVPSAQHGIRIKHTINHTEIASAIISESAGATTIHDHSFFVEEDCVWICVSDMVYCLNLPNLTLNWSQKYDSATNFGIYPFKEEFIIHGELSIFRISRAGAIKWEFGGKDIFVSQNGEASFQIKDDTIGLSDWEGNVYCIDGNGEVISNE